MTRSRIALLLSALALVSVAVVPARAACGAPPSMPTMQFDQPTIVDPVRAGGEPSVIGLPNGNLVYAAHAGTTHLYKPNLPDPDFVTPYSGSNYVWWSDDVGSTWHYAGLNGGDVGPHAGPGFSDPSLAVDLTGNVYVLGIDLANVYAAKSSDGGKTWEGNPIAAVMTDRPWLAADREDVVYMAATNQRGRVLLRSTDGAKTWDTFEGLRLGGSFSPITVDQRDGRLYYPATDPHTRFDTPADVVIFPSLRAGMNERIVSVVWDGLPNTHGFLNPSAVDADGNIYIAANTGSEVRLAYSSDRGLTWKTSLVHRSTAGDVLWPWVSAGADGRVAVTWFQSDGSASSYQAAGRFRIYAASTVTAHGWVDACNSEHPPVWKTVVATPEPFHEGEICESGLGCNTDLDVSGDRRLGDYHTNAITADGQLVIAYGNTSFKPNAAISHPAFVRQLGGVDFIP